MCYDNVCNKTSYMLASTIHSYIYYLHVNEKQQAFNLDIQSSLCHY